MKTIKDYWKHFWEVFSKPDMLILPGHLAFFFFLSVVPIITLITYVASYFSLSVDFMYDFITNSFGSDIANLVVPVINSEFSMGFVITLLIGFFIASNGASAIIVISNRFYGIDDAGYLARRIKAIIMTFIIVLLFMFILAVPLLGDFIIELITHQNFDASVSNQVITIFNVLNGPISWFIIFFFIKFILTMAPDRKIPSSYVNYGSLFTSLGWILITSLYSTYIGLFANYDLFYGSLANIIVLMLWVYLLAYVLVIGIGMNNRREIDKFKNRK